LLGSYGEGGGGGGGQTGGGGGSGQVGCEIAAPNPSEVVRVELKEGIRGVGLVRVYSKN